MSTGYKLKSFKGKAKKPMAQKPSKMMKGGKKLPRVAAKKASMPIGEGRAAVVKKKKMSRVY